MNLTNLGDPKLGKICTQIRIFQEEKKTLIWFSQTFLTILGTNM